MYRKFFFILAIAVLPASSFGTEPGAYIGAKPSEVPSWFKESFLEFEEDVAEAARQNRRVMLYFHQEGCPYCAKLVEENFTRPELKTYIQEHFDGIEINMWGDREIVSIQGKTFTEKTFAAALKVQYTPTLVFLDEQGKVALRLNGYYPPRQFQQALRYVAEKKEKTLSFNEFTTLSTKHDDGPLIGEDFFLPDNDLQKLLRSSEKFVAVYFEAPACEECKILHQKILSDPPTRELVRKMDNLQLNVLSDEKVITPDGETMSQQEFARKLKIGYTPTVVLLDTSGREVHRIEGFLKTFHFQSSLAYVLDLAYLSEPSFQRYISARGEKLREQGYDTDIWGYRSLHPARVEE
jgi:thioredoxin-related protein